MRGHVHLVQGQFQILSSTFLSSSHTFCILDNTGWGLFERAYKSTSMFTCEWLAAGMHLREMSMGADVIAVLLVLTGGT